MNKQKEIEEMAICVDETCDDVEDNKCNSRKCSLCISKHLVGEGYRKADEVRKETAKEILKEVRQNAGGRWLAELCEKYGVEVDE